jgi:hypothetical protein
MEYVEAINAADVHTQNYLASKMSMNIMPTCQHFADAAWPFFEQVHRLNDWH